MVLLVHFGVGPHERLHPQTFHSNRRKIWEKWIDKEVMDENCEEGPQMQSLHPCK